MDRKHRLGLWEDAQNRRLTHDNDLELLIRRIVKGVKIIGKESKISVSLLKALKKGKKGVMQWILCWIRQLFWLISMILSQRHLRKHWFFVYYIFDVRRSWSITRSRFGVHSSLSTYGTIAYCHIWKGFLREQEQIQQTLVIKIVKINDCSSGTDGRRVSELIFGCG